jgi:hypothetical protein
MIVPVFLPHLGCHDRCIYCNQVFITEVEDSLILDLVERTLPRRGRYEVGLFGGNIFGLTPGQLERLFSFFDPYREWIINFRISTKPVPLDEEILTILKLNGVTLIELGTPTLNDAILHVLNRKHSASEFFEAYSLLREEGFEVAMQVMIGLPGETSEDLQAMAAAVTDLQPSYIRVYPLVVLEETPLEKLYREGSFLPLSLEEAVARSVFLYLSATRAGIPVVKMGLTDNEVLKERIIAGPFHGAFGFLVKSEAFYLAVRALIAAEGMEGQILVSLNSRDIPHLIGDRRRNMVRFREDDLTITWEAAPITVGSFRLTSGGVTTEGSIYDTPGLESFFTP